MEALKFMNEFARMCNSFVNDDNTLGCSGCPLEEKNCTVSSEEAPKELILREVEKWSKAHPKKTRQSEFLKIFPHAKTLPTGIPAFSPCEMDCRIAQDRHCDFGCNACREDYWLQEVE